MPTSRRQRGRNAQPPRPVRSPGVESTPNIEHDPAKLEQIPVTYQALNDYFLKLGEVDPFAIRRETFLRIEQITGRPLICYVTKTHHLAVPDEVAPLITAYVEDSDLVGFSDLVDSITGTAVDVFIVSNGGEAETAERIVRLLRERFQHVRFIVPANAYSAATLICFSGDEILMDVQGTLGPIDPQIGGIPTRSILRAFEGIEQRLKEEGPTAITAYLPLIEKYDLHILEICKSVEDLSKELARQWISKYMLKCDTNSDEVSKIVDYFSSYDLHKSHGRSINRDQAREQGLVVVNVEDIEGLGSLVRSLQNQYELWFSMTNFYKLFESAHGINWGRNIPMNIAPDNVPATPRPGRPQRSN